MQLFLVHIVTSEGRGLGSDVILQTDWVELGISSDPIYNIDKMGGFVQIWHDTPILVTYDYSLASRLHQN